jgi:hypothetical protein
VTSSASTDALSAAASLLEAVGADRARVPAAPALDCLYAAELLEAAGARIEPARPAEEDPRAGVRAAMTALGSLEADLFADSRIVEAARAVRRAHRALG